MFTIPITYTPFAMLSPKCEVPEPAATAILDAPSFQLSETSKYSARTITTCDDDTTDTDSSIGVPASNHGTSLAELKEELCHDTKSVPSENRDLKSGEVDIRTVVSDPELGFCSTANRNISKEQQGDADNKPFNTKLLGTESDVTQQPASASHETERGLYESRTHKSQREQHGDTGSSDFKEFSNLQLFSFNEPQQSFQLSEEVTSLTALPPSGNHSAAPGSPMPPDGATAYVVPGPRGASDIVVEGEEELEMPQKVLGYSKHGRDDVSSVDRGDGLEETTTSEELPWWKQFLCWSPTPSYVAKRNDLHEQGTGEREQPDDIRDPVEPGLGE